MRGLARGSRRVVYTVRYRLAVYVLHAFRKKSKRGIGTPAEDMDKIRRRLAQAETDYAQRFPDAPDRS